MSLLSLDGVSKLYGRKTVLAGVDHRFTPGLTLLTGASGAGKSTLLRLIATVERSDAGTIAWDGVALPAGRQALRRDLGYAPQAVDLPDDLTAREFAMHMAALKGLARAAADRQFGAIMDAIGLYADIDDRIGTFSGGMRRRLIFAQAMLGAPRLIVLDEPMAELDPETAAKVEALVVERAGGAVVIMTTHGGALASAAVLRVEAGRVAPSRP